MRIKVKMDSHQFSSQLMIWFVFLKNVESHRSTAVGAAILRLTACVCDKVKNEPTWLHPHSKHGFSASSSKLCQNWLHHWKGYLYRLYAAVHRCFQHVPKGLENVAATQRPNIHINMRCICPRYKKSSISVQTILICDDISNMGSYKRNAWYNLSCLLQIYCHLSTNEKLLADSLLRPMA